MVKICKYSVQTFQPINLIQAKLDKYRTNKEDDKDEHVQMKGTRNIDDYSHDREYKNKYQRDDKEVRFIAANDTRSIICWLKTIRDCN